MGKVKKALIKTWEFLDKKKTVIGGAMVWASTLVKQHTIAYAILYYGGSLLGGTGVVHKIIKGELSASTSSATVLRYASLRSKRER